MQKKKEPPCETCKNRPPDRMPGIEPLYQCIILCDSQVRAGFGGIYGLDWNVVIAVAKSMDIRIDDLFFARLKACEAVIVTEANQGAKSGRSADKPKDKR